MRLITRPHSTGPSADSRPVAAAASPRPWCCCSACWSPAACTPPSPRLRADREAPTRTRWPRAAPCSWSAAPPATARTPRASTPRRATSTAPRWSASAPPRSTSRSAPAGCRWPSPAPRPCASPRSTTRRRSRRSRRTSPRSAPVPDIPTESEYDVSDATNEDIVRGGEFFRTNCTACHNFAGTGGALPRGRYAPPAGRRLREAHLRGHAHRPPADAGLLRRGAHARGEARHHRLPEEDRGDARRTAASRSARSVPVVRGPVRLARRHRRPRRLRHLDRGQLHPLDREEDRRRHERRQARTVDAPGRDRADPRPGPARAPAPPDRRRRGAPRSAPSARSPPCSGSRPSVTLLFCVSYFVFDGRRRPDRDPRLRRLQRRPRHDPRPGLLCIGIGTIQWARKLMSDHEIVEYRHPGGSSDEDREETVAMLEPGTEESGIGRRPLIRNSLLGADGRLLGLRRDRPAARPRPAARRQALPDRLEEGHAGRPGRRRHPDQARATWRSASSSTPSRRSSSRRTPTASRWSRASSSRREKAKAAVIMVRMQPDDITPAPGSRELGRRRHPVLLQDLHPRRLPDLAVGAADPPPALPVPPVDLRPRRQRQGHLRTGRPSPAPAAVGGGRRGLPDRHQRLHRAGRPQLLGTGTMS